MDDAVDQRALFLFAFYGQGRCLRGWGRNSFRADNLNETRLEEAVYNPAEFQLVHVNLVCDLAHRVFRVNIGNNTPFFNGQIYIPDIGAGIIREAQRHIQAWYFVLEPFHFLQPAGTLDDDVFQVNLKGYFVGVLRLERISCWLK